MCFSEAYRGLGQLASEPAALPLINFSRNRTLHCGITGPIFVVGAVAAAFIEAGKWAFDLRVVWGIVLLGVALAFAIEWRTAGPDDGSNACSTPQP